ncbi:MAG: hypothetical protein AAGC63_00545 [Propionicimonas sp.]|nr:hypothetical protein [Propionicimonas sp.]
MITVQPIRYTSHTASWHRLAVELGFTAAIAPTPQWSEFDGNGILAVHGVAAGGPDDGSSGFHLLAGDLEAVAARLAAIGVEVERRHPEDVGPMLVVRAADGVTLTVSGEKRAARAGGTSVQPIWYDTDLDRPRQVLEAIGLQPRIVADDGVWIDFTADGGGLGALHRDTTPRVELSLEFGGDLDALADRLAGAGFRASVVDEAYNRTLQVTTPDGDVLWVNGTHDDLSGYSRATATPAGN